MRIGLVKLIRALAGTNASANEQQGVPVSQIQNLARYQVCCQSCGTDITNGGGEK